MRDGLAGAGNASTLNFAGRAGLLAAMAMAMAAAMLSSAGGNPSGSSVYSIPGLGPVVANLVGVSAPSPMPTAQPSPVPSSAPTPVSTPSSSKAPQPPPPPRVDLPPYVTVPARFLHLPPQFLLLLLWIVVRLIPLALVAIGLAILLPLVLPNLGSLGWLRRSRREVATELERAVATALEELETTEIDPRLAVIAAYSRMENTLSTYVQPRLPSETPFEFVSRALVPLRVSRPPVQRLTELFELASYSHHKINDEMRTDALGAVSSIQAELRAQAATG